MSSSGKPVNKKFAPNYATGHSLVANNICHNAEKVISEQSAHIKNVMVAKQE
jgi:hypothetical protein|tara:strand:+ start:1400 stop:1555 length:156 start_codon:yes stop_codon:yes gene_type:complete